jgi:hypothetical protein
MVMVGHVRLEILVCTGADECYGALQDDDGPFVQFVTSGGSAIA